MEENVKKQKFVQLQFCIMLVICTLLPDFGSVIGVSNLDVSVLIAQLVGIIGGGVTLFTFYKALGNELPIPFLALSGGGLLISLISVFPGMPNWLAYIGLVVLIIAFFMAKSNLKVSWNNLGSGGAYLILIALLLHVYDSIGDTVLTGVAALIGLVLYILGLGKIKVNIDDKGKSGISKLKIAVILSIIAVILGWIPLFGGIISGIVVAIAFLIELLGYGTLKQSQSLGAEGQNGAGKLQISMIIMLVASIIDLFPFSGMIVGIISLIALFLVFKGWNMILNGMENQMK